MILQTIAYGVFPSSAVLKAGPTHGRQDQETSTEEDQEDHEASAEDQEDHEGSEGSVVKDEETDDHEEQGPQWGNGMEMGRFVGGDLWQSDAIVGHVQFQVRFFHCDVIVGVCDAGEVVVVAILRHCRVNFTDLNYQ